MSGSSKSLSRSLRRNSWIQSRAPFSRDRLLELLRVGIFLMELLQVVGRPIDEELVGGGQGRDEEAVGLGPGPADGQLVQHLDHGLLAVDEQADVGAAEGQVLVVLDVVPVEADVLGGERLPVRPFVALAQAQGEDPAVLDLVARQDVGDELELGREADQVRIAVGVEEAGVALAADQHPQLAAGLADLDALDHPRLVRGGRHAGAAISASHRRHKPSRLRPDHARSSPAEHPR